MFSDYRCTVCEHIELIRKTTPYGVGFEQTIKYDCEVCKKETVFKRVFSKPVISISEGYDSDFGYTPAPLSPMNKIQHFNMGRGRTVGVEREYTVAPE